MSSYALLSGFRLPWPPSCCQDGPTSFLVSGERIIGPFNACFWFIPHPQFCLPKHGPLGKQFHFCSPPWIQSAGFIYFKERRTLKKRKNKKGEKEGKNKEEGKEETSSMLKPPTKQALLYLAVCFVVKTRKSKQG